MTLYIIKFFFLIFYAFYQSNFVWNSQALTSKKLYEVYVHQPYLFHLNTNSSIILRNTVSEVGVFSASVMAATNFLGEILVILGILSIMFIFEPIGTLVVFNLVLIGSIIFYLYVKDRVKIYGETRQYHEGLRIKSLQEGLGAIKHIKLSSIENKIINNFYFHSQSSANASKFNSILQFFPRLWLELISVISVLLVVIYFAYSNQDFEKIIVLLGIFAAGAIRIIPAANRILYNIQSIRFAIPVISNLSKQVKMP